MAQGPLIGAALASVFLLASIFVPQNNVTTQFEPIEPTHSPVVAPLPTLETPVIPDPIATDPVDPVDPNPPLPDVSEPVKTDEITTNPVIVPSGAEENVVSQPNQSTQNAHVHDEDFSFVQFVKNLRQDPARAFLIELGLTTVTIVFSLFVWFSTKSENVELRLKLKESGDLVALKEKLDAERKKFEEAKLNYQNTIVDQDTIIVEGSERLDQKRDAIKDLKEQRNHAILDAEENKMKLEDASDRLTFTEDEANDLRRLKNSLDQQISDLAKNFGVELPKEEAWTPIAHINYIIKVALGLPDKESTSLAATVRYIQEDMKMQTSKLDHVSAKTDNVDKDVKNLSQTINSFIQTIEEQLKFRNISFDSQAKGEGRFKDLMSTLWEAYDNVVDNNRKDKESADIANLDTEELPEELDNEPELQNAEEEEAAAKRLEEANKAKDLEEKERIAKENRIAAEEKKKAEELQAQEKKKADEAKAEEQRLADLKAAEDKKKADEAKVEEQRLADLKVAEEKKKADELKAAADEKKKADEAKAEEQRLEDLKAAEEKKKADEKSANELKADDEKKKTEELKPVEDKQIDAHPVDTSATYPVDTHTTSATNNTTDNHTSPVLETTVTTSH